MQILCPNQVELLNAIRNLFYRKKKDKGRFHLLRIAVLRQAAGLAAEGRISQGSICSSTVVQSEKLRDWFSPQSPLKGISPGDILLSAQGTLIICFGRPEV